MIWMAENLGADSGGASLFRGACFTCEPGVITVVAGPNGAGKSTLLRIMAGLQEPAEGMFFCEDESGRTAVRMLDPRERARRIAFAAQDAPADIPLTVGEIVALGRSPRQRMFERFGPEDREASEDAMRRMGVLHLSDRSLQRLSGGERQRVMLARALCQDAALLLLDEPCAALDYAWQAALMDVLSEECARGKAVAMVAHDLNIAARWGGSVLLLAGGRLLGGTPSEVLEPCILREAFGCEFLVDGYPCCSAPRVTLLGRA